MARVKRGVTTRAKHKNILEQAKGYRGRRKNTIRVARQAARCLNRLPFTRFAVRGAPFIDTDSKIRLAI